MTVVLLSILGLATVFTFWVMICNERTYRQRMRILNAIPLGTGQFWDLSHAMDRVEYNEHMWALIFFKDPMTLYPPVIRDLMRE